MGSRKLDETTSENTDRRKKTFALRLGEVMFCEKILEGISFSACCIQKYKIWQAWSWYRAIKLRSFVSTMAFPTKVFLDKRRLLTEGPLSRSKCSLPYCSHARPPGTFLRPVRGKPNERVWASMNTPNRISPVRLYKVVPMILAQ